MTIQRLILARTLKNSHIRVSGKLIPSVLLECDISTANYRISIILRILRRTMRYLLNNTRQELKNSSPLGHQILQKSCQVIVGFSPKRFMKLIYSSKLGRSSLRVFIRLIFAWIASCCFGETPPPTLFSFSVYTVYPVLYLISLFLELIFSYT